MSLADAFGFGPSASRPRYSPPKQIPNQNQRPINPAQLMQYAMGLKGDPEAMVRSMLQNGQMSQEQFNALGQQATQLGRMPQLSQFMRMFGMR